MLNPTLLRALGNLLEKQSGRPISIPKTGQQGTIIGGEWRPQTHQVRQYERGEPIPVAAGDVVGGDAPHTPIRYERGVDSKLVDVVEDRLVRDIEHIMPESGRGTVPPEQQVANLARMLLIGMEQGRISSSSPLMKELLEAVDNIPLDQKALAQQNMAKLTDATVGVPKIVRELSKAGELKDAAGNRIDPKLFDELFQPDSRSGKMALSDEGGPVATMKRNLQGKATPAWGATISYDNMHEMIMRMLTKGGVQPTKARSIAYDEMAFEPGAMSVYDKASSGQKAIQRAIEGLEGKDFPYAGGSGLAAMNVTNRLQGAGHGLMGGSERVLLRAMMGDPNVGPKLRKALGEAVYLKGGKEAESVAEAIASGRMDALTSSGVATKYGSRRLLEAIERGAADTVDAPLIDPSASRYAKMAKSRQLDDIATKSDKTLKGEQYAEDPTAVPRWSASDYADRAPMFPKGQPKKQITPKERELIDRTKADEVPESTPIKTDEIVGPKLERGNTMDLDGSVGKAELTTQGMFDLKNKIDEQLDDLIKSTRGIDAPKKEVGGIIDFRKKVQETKRQLEAAWEKQDFDKVVEIGHRIDEGNLSNVSDLSLRQAKSAHKVATRRSDAAAARKAAKESGEIRRQELEAKRQKKEAEQQKLEDKQYERTGKPERAYPSEKAIDDYYLNEPAPNDVQGWKKFAENHPETAYWRLKAEVSEWFDRMIKQGETPEDAAHIAMAEWIK